MTFTPQSGIFIHSYTFGSYLSPDIGFFGTSCEAYLDPTNQVDGITTHDMVIYVGCSVVYRTSGRTASDQYRLLEISRKELLLQHDRERLTRGFYFPCIPITVCSLYKSPLHLLLFILYCRFLLPNFSREPLRYRFVVPKKCANQILFVLKTRDMHSNGIISQ